MKRLLSFCVLIITASLICSCDEDTQCPECEKCTVCEDNKEQCPVCTECTECTECPPLDGNKECPVCEECGGKECPVCEECKEKECPSCPACEECPASGPVGSEDGERITYYKEYSMSDGSTYRVLSPYDNVLNANVTLRTINGIDCFLPQGYLTSFQNQDYYTDDNCENLLSDKLVLAMNIVGLHCSSYGLSMKKGEIFGRGRVVKDGICIDTVFDAYLALGDIEQQYLYSKSGATCYVNPYLVIPARKATIDEVREQLVCESTR